MCKVLVWTKEDGADVISRIDDIDTLKKVLSFEDLNGVKEGPMAKMRVNLAKLRLNNEITSTDLDNLITNIGKLDSKPGMDSLVKRLYEAKVNSNFKGAAFEAEFAASSPNNVLALGMKTGGTPGDIDVLMREGNDIIGYECKAGQYGTSEYDKEELLGIRDGFGELRQNNVIDGYKIMFRDRPRQDVIDWMNSQGIQWDYFVK